MSGPYSVPSIRGGTATAAGASTSAGTASKAAAAAATASDQPKLLPSPVLNRNGVDPSPPTVSCTSPGQGCDQISNGPGGAVGVKGLNDVDSSALPTNHGTPFPDIEPSDQGLCAGNGYVVEDDNIGEVLVFNTRLHRASQVVSLDNVMGLQINGHDWSSGGDISCLYDHSNGGHWFFTDFVSASSETAGGAFTGCFAGQANGCYEGIAVSDGNSPFGPYHVYYSSADYNPAEPGSPYLLNDFAKIATTRDAFLLFYDEFTLNSKVPGIGGGGFNGAQQFAFDKNGMERGLPPSKFNVAIENMGYVATPDGTCASDNLHHRAGVTCWYAVIPAQAPDSAQFDNAHGGSGFMLGTLDYYGQGDTRLAAWDWTGLSALNGNGHGIKFGGTLFSGVNFYYGEGFLAAQKAGPIPLGNECGAAGLSTGSPAPASCPEGGIETNGDFMTQVSQAQGQIWGATATEVSQSFASGAEVHQGAIDWVIGTRGFDHGGALSLSSEGYVSAAHEDLAYPAIAAGDHGPAVMAFTLTGNDYYPSTAYGRLTATSGTLLNSRINVADLGQSPQDGFTEYMGYPGPTSPRWGDYSWAVYDPGTGKAYFATGYIQYPSCTGSAFTLTVGTCGGTRDGYGNWGTSVNAVQP